jgi:hypothetical protein
MKNKKLTNSDKMKRNTPIKNWKKFKSSSKRSCSSMNLFFSLIILLWSHKINHIHKFPSPIITNMNIIKPIFDHQNDVIKISIPNFDHQKFVITLTTLKICFISICTLQFKALDKSWRTHGNCTTCCAHQVKGSSSYIDCIGKHRQ